MKQKKSVKRKEQQKGAVMDFTAAPYTPCPCAAWHGRGGRGVRNKGAKLFCVSQYPTLCLIANELNYFSLCVFPIMVTGKRSPCLYAHP